VFFGGSIDSLARARGTVVAFEALLAGRVRGGIIVAGTRQARRY